MQDIIVAMQTCIAAGMTCMPSMKRSSGVRMATWKRKTQHRARADLQAPGDALHRRRNALHTSAATLHRTYAMHHRGHAALQRLDVGQQTCGETCPVAQEVCIDATQSSKGCLQASKLAM
jgi:hypothetical protein